MLPTTFLTLLVGFWIVELELGWSCMVGLGCPKIAVTAYVTTAYEDDNRSLMGKTIVIN